MQVNPFQTISPLRWIRRIVDRMAGGRLGLAIAALSGVAVGLGLLAFQVSNAKSYMSDAPEACINCHVMDNAYATWRSGSHGKVAVCNDCHVPHDNPVARTLFKARDGLKHSAVFTLRVEPQVLRLAEGATEVVQGNCVRCHRDQLGMVRVAAPGERRCWDCHENVHGDVRSVSSSPNVRFRRP